MSVILVKLLNEDLLAARLVNCIVASHPVNLPQHVTVRSSGETALSHLSTIKMSLSCLSGCIYSPSGVFECAMESKDH